MSAQLDIHDEYKQQPLPEAIYSVDGEYLTLHSQGMGESVYEDWDGNPISVDNEYAYCQIEKDIFDYE